MSKDPDVRSPRSVHPSLAVPPGRLGHDLRAPTLLAYSFLSPAAFDELVASGTLRAHAEYVDPVDPYAYAWMSAQLTRRCGAPPATWPIWVWAKTTRRQLVADAHRYARMDPGTVLVTCRLARDRVLVSEFADWHCVLNAALVLPRSLSDAEFERAFDDWDARFTAAVPDGSAPRETWPPDVLEELHASWEAIFDVDAYPRRSFWQGCVAELHTDDVIRAMRLDPDATRNHEDRAAIP